MISALLHAQRTTQGQRWSDSAHRVFGWFLGQNQLRQALHDPSTGGCRDALHADRVNQNQGAESTLSFLLALVEMRASATHTELERELTGAIADAGSQAVISIFETVQ